MSVNLTQLEPGEAVRVALSGAHDDPSGLDAYLFQRVLWLLLDGRGDSGALGAALVDAVDGTPDDTRWAERWRLMLELVREARTAPSAARDRVHTTGRAADVLRAVARARGAVLPSELARELDMQPPQVTKLLHDLDAADLVQRQRVGRNVWVTLSERGARLVGRDRPEPAEDLPTAPRLSLWTSRDRQPAGAHP